MLAVKRRTGSVKLAYGSDLRGTASPEGWQAFLSITNSVRLRFIALLGLPVPEGAFPVAAFAGLLL